MAQFKKLKYKNILSTGDDWQEYDFEGQPLLLVIGKNGAGKTTLIDALFFALYGEAFRDIVKDKLINSVNKKGLLVELSFTSGPTEYFIRRGISPNVFEFFVNGVQVPRDATVKDYQVKVQNAIRIDKKSLKQQVILASRSYVPFMRLAAPERRMIIQDVLDIQVFSDMAAITKKEMDAVKEEMKGLEDEIREYQHKIALERSKITTSQESNLESISRYERRNDVLRGEIEHLESDLADLTEQTKDLDDKLNRQSELDASVTNKTFQRSKIKDKWERIGEEIGFYKCNDSCPTCRQTIDDGFKAETVAALQSKREAVVNEGLALKEIADTEKQELAELKLTVKTLQVLAQKITVKNGDINSKLREIRNNDMEIGKLRRATEVKGADEAKIYEYQVEYNKATAKKTNLSNQLDLLKTAAILLKDDGIKTQIIRKYLPTINATINKFIRMMGSNFTFDMNETFNEKIKDQYGETYSYHSFSEGEKMRFDLAILFTWREIAKLRNTTDTNLLIMDEVLDASLDVDGAEDFMKIISEIVKDTNTIVISHKSEQIRDRFDKVIEFKKVKKFSQMKVLK